MKKFAVSLCLAAFMAACTAPGITEDQETDIQIIDKKDYEIPSDKYDKDKDKDENE